MGIFYGMFLEHNFNQQSDVRRFQTCVLTRNNWGCKTSIHRGSAVNMGYNGFVKTSNVIFGCFRKLGCTGS